MNFLKPDTLTALRGFARKPASTAAIALLSMTMSLGCGTGTDRAVFVATAYGTDSSVPSSDEQLVAAAQLQLLDSGGHDFEPHYGLFASAKDDLGRTHTIIDLAATPYPKHVINIASYMTRVDASAVATVCSMLLQDLGATFAIVPARLNGESVVSCKPSLASEAHSSRKGTGRRGTPSRMSVATRTCDIASPTYLGTVRYGAPTCAIQ